MKDLILIIGDNTYQFDKMEDLYDSVIGKNDGNYSSLAKLQRDARRYDIAFINANCNPERIGYLTDTPSDQVEDSKKIFIDSDEAYVLSILKAGIATLLVQKQTDLARSVGIDENMSDNYVILNLWAGKLLNQCRKRLIAEQKDNSKPKVNLTKQSMPNFDHEKSSNTNSKLFLSSIDVSKNKSSDFSKDDREF